MTSITLQETVKAKQTFEIFAEQLGVQILHYNCNNGRFADNAFKQVCKSAGQHLTFCGTNAHFQNGIAEKAICNLQKSARKQLLRAQQ
jgi:hypothetical protein